jgi:hypothetical protein
MLYAGYKVIGIARAYNDSSTYRWYWVTDFGGVVDQTGAGTLQFSAATYTVNEYAGSATITVTRAGGSSGAVAVSYATSNGTATAGSDYAATSGTLYWSDGDTAGKTFAVPIVNDSASEGNETVNLTLSNPTGGAILGSPSTAALTIVDQQPQPPPPSGTSFVFWRNISTGENTVWYMNGSTHTATAALEPLTGPWRMVGTADFNSDGEPDILWRNFATGANMVWYMNGATHTGSADLTPLTDQNWKIAGVADFNDDGAPDILWRNISTGANMVWYMNGATHTGSADLAAITDQNWKIVGTADFNSDGEGDILWRNSVTGQSFIWYMEGITRTGLALLDTVTDQNWKMIAGTTDLNKDRKPDVLWRNTATGANMVWYMNGITHTSVVMLDTVTDQNMEMAGQGNY